MKKKVAIVTIVHGANYGNRLQNYALQRTIENLGFECVTFKRNVYMNLMSSLKNQLFIPLKRTPGMKKRYKMFDDFNNKYINFTDYILYNRKTVNKSEIYKYYAFVCGSDQIWNPNWSTNCDKDFLTFAPIGKRISYAASFGVEKIRSEKVQEYKKYISEIDYLSVRENSGAQLVSELTGKRAEVVLDPTLLLNESDWIKLEEKPENFPESPYVLCYFLAGCCDERKKQIQEFSYKNGLIVLEIDIKENDSSFSYSPNNFLYLINHAQHIFTDSFHCTVFSIIFHKEFDVFQRKIGVSNMSDRIVTLLKTCGIKDRIDRDSLDESPINYELVDERILLERDHSIDFLRKSLRVNKSE